MSINLYAAQNAYQSFQVVVQSPPGGLSNVALTASDLAGANGNSIEHQNISLYREYYVQVDQPSPDRGGPNYSLGVGWYPDPLIPFNDPLTAEPLSGGLYQGQPFNLAAGSNQAIWIDIYVPPGTPADEYTGSIVVSSNQGNATATLNLAVWSFALPSGPTLKSVFQYWTQTSSSAIEELLRNKIMPQSVADSAVSAPFLVQNFGLTMTTTGFWSGAAGNNCVMSPTPSVSQFLQAVSANPAGLYLANYTADEIDSCTNLYPSIQAWARNMHAAGINNLVVMNPVLQLLDDGSGMGKPAVDIWVVLPSGYLEGASVMPLARAAGSQIWSYSTLSQDGYSPKWLIDFDPINLRLQAGFLSETFGLTGLLYWRVDGWNSDPWNLVNNEGVFGTNNYPGEGVLVYPGAPAGVNGVVPSMRLKQLRDGVQDYELVEMLKRLGRGDFALQAIKAVAPDWANWTHDGNALEAVRRQLGDEIHRLTGQVKAETPRRPH